MADNQQQKTPKSFAVYTDIAVLTPVTPSLSSKIATQPIDDHNSDDSEKENINPFTKQRTHPTAMQQAQNFAANPGNQHSLRDVTHLHEEIDRSCTPAQDSTAKHSVNMRNFR